MLTYVLLLVGGLAAASADSLPCQKPFDRMPFCDVAKPHALRVAALVGALNVSEKIGLLGDTSPGAPRLGLPPYEWWNEGLHGVANSYGVAFRPPTPFATSFALPILTAAAFDRELWAAIGRVVSVEARAFFNAGNAGLTFWSPVINIARDPRWGRTQETSGEDPYLTSQYAIRFVRALEGTDGTAPPGRRRIASCPKHAYAYSMENSDGVERFSFNAVVTARDLNDTYLPAFLAAVAPGGGGGACQMCAYVAVNGIPACADANFFNNVMRRDYGFKGYVVSDCGAISTIQYSHNYTQTTSETCAVAMQAGVDLNCGNFYQQNMAAALADGSVDESQIDAALTHQFEVLMQLGYFDGSQHPFAGLGPANVSTYEHTELANRGAVESMVLLKNDGALPLTGGDDVLVLGPNADDPSVMIGNYYGDPAFIITPFAGIAEFSNAELIKGVGCNSQNKTGFQAACAAVARYATVVLVMGTNLTVEAENIDRVEIGLPGLQPAFVDLMLTCGSNDTVFVLVLASGGAIDVSQWIDDARVNAIMWMGYGGQYAGRALAELLFGLESPSGRLPMTFYDQAYADSVEMINMNMRPDATASPPFPGRTYRFYTGEPVAWFGAGLSYTTFAFAWSSSVAVLQAHALERAVAAPQYNHFARFDRTRGAVTLQCNVTNTGMRTSDVSVLAMVVPPQTSGAPQRQLVEFERVRRLRPGHWQLVTFQVGAHAFVDGDNRAIKGEWHFADADAWQGRKHVRGVKVHVK
jgi:xylan 1,4-beta-xylosidase